MNSSRRPPQQLSVPHQFKWTFALLCGFGLIAFGIWFARQPKFRATANFALNQAAFSSVFDPALLPSPNPHFVPSAIEQIQSQKIIYPVLSNLGVAANSEAYRATISRLVFRKSEAPTEQPTHWLLEYRDDDPDRCVNLLNAVLTNYETLLAEDLARKNYQGTPIFALARPATKAARRFPLDVLLAGSGSVVIALASVALGRLKMAK